MSPGESFFQTFQTLFHVSVFFRTIRLAVIPSVPVVVSVKTPSSRACVGSDQPFNYLPPLSRSNRFSSSLRDLILTGFVYVITNLAAARLFPVIFRDQLPTSEIRRPFCQAFGLETCSVDLAGAHRNVWHHGVSGNEPDHAEYAVDESVLVRNQGRRRSQKRQLF